MRELEDAARDRARSGSGVGEAVISRLGGDRAIVAGAVAIAIGLALGACSRGDDGDARSVAGEATQGVGVTNGAGTTNGAGATSDDGAGVRSRSSANDAPAAADASVRTVVANGITFRDLNRNGQLDPYEDSRLSPEARADDLVKRMTLEEKAGAMMHDTLPGLGAQIGASAQGYNFEVLQQTIAVKHVNSFITRLQLPPAQLAEQNNKVQALAERTRLGIPVTISTDPRSHFQFVLGATSSGAGFSQWPETLGFAAIGDEDLVRRFADIARQEYRAVGIHMALSPQADLATEPRWSRTTGTFGSRASAVSDLVGAYVEGFQHGKDGVAADGVATIVKHWVGYGAQPNGFDAHNYYGRFARLTDASFAQHVAAFQGAFDSHVAGVMPAYPILQGITVNGKPVEQVAPGYNKPLLDLLRGQHRYAGIILSDWAVTRDCSEACVAPTSTDPQRAPAIATPWGVEKLGRVERFAKGVAAGLDQFGGTGESELLVDAVERGLVQEARLDESVRRVMILKFRQGLFDNPFVDAAKAASLVGTEEFRKEGEAAQRRAQVILENHEHLLPLDAKTRKVWLFGIDAGAARAAGFTVVATLAAANVAIVRVSTPFETLHPHYFFGALQHEGRLDFRDGDPGYEAIKRASAAKVPTIVAVDMDRPAILTNVRARAKVLMAVFGASDAALLDVIAGRARAEGRLPFELPSSMRAVEGQDSARADDSVEPLYAVGAGGT